MDCDVVVVGAGLAGLRCADVLHRSGLSVVVLDAADAVGGRIRTDRVDGYLCDRGFQLLNPAYPAVRRLVDLGRLGLQSFGSGVACRRDTGLRVVADPRRSPGRLPATLRSGLLDAREVAALLRWIGPTAARPRHAQAHDDGATLTESFEAAGVRGRLRTEVLEPFLAGVLADASGETSAGFVKLLVRSFLLGTPGLPRDGMQALPEQLAEPLRHRLRLGVRVGRVEDGADGVTVRSDADALAARAAVVAVGAEASGALTGQAAPTTHALTTWWFAAAEAPYSQKLLTVDGRGSGTSSARAGAARCGGEQRRAVLRARGAAPRGGDVPAGPWWRRRGGRGRRPSAPRRALGTADPRLGPAGPARDHARAAVPAGAAPDRCAGPGGGAGVRRRRPSRHGLDPGCAGLRGARRPGRARRARLTARPEMVRAGSTVVGSVPGSLDARHTTIRSVMCWQATATWCAIRSSASNGPHEQAVQGSEEHVPSCQPDDPRTR